MPETPWEDEFALLCERCGYVVEGLDTSGNCPECWKPIAESLPERRVGTPWQQRPNVSSLVKTWWATLRHPVATVDDLHLGRRDNARALAMLTIILAGVITSAGYFSTPLVFPGPFGKPAIGEVLGVVLALSPVPILVLMTLTFIEGFGLRVIGRSRRFRMDANASTTIVAHGCVGWLLTAVGFAIARYAGAALIYAMTPSQEDSGFGALDEYMAIFAARPPGWVYGASWVLTLLGALPGFLFFETFAWLGLRRCRFANRPRPEAPRSEPGA